MVWLIQRFSNNHIRGRDDNLQAVYKRSQYMKTFKQFLKEGRKSGLYKGHEVTYNNRDIDKEYGEVQSRPADTIQNPRIRARYQQMADNKSEWDKSVAGGKAVEFSREQLKAGEVGNAGGMWKKEQPKSERDSDEIQRMHDTKIKMKKRIGAGVPIRRPVAIRDPETGQVELIGGSHRTRWLASKTGRVSMHVIEGEQ